MAPLAPVPDAQSLWIFLLNLPVAVCLLVPHRGSLTQFTQRVKREAPVFLMEHNEVLLTADGARAQWVTTKKLRN